MRPIVAAGGRRIRERRRRPRRLPRPRAPKNIERQYGKAIMRLVEPLKSTIAGIKQALPELIALGPHNRDHADADFGASIRRVVNSARISFAEQVPDKQIERVTENASEEIAAQQADQFKEQMIAAVGVQPIQGEPWLRGVLEDATRQNVDLISTIPERYFDSVEQTIREGVLAGRRHEEISADLQSFVDGDDWDKVENRAALIARDQTMSLFGTLSRVRQEDVGIKSYVWRTAMDERVRPEHEEREGEQFDWDEPPDDGHPGMPINCRCVAEPVFEEIEEE